MEQSKTQLTEAANRRLREQQQIQASNWFTKARQVIIEEEEISILINTSKRKAGNKLLQIATLLEQAGKVYLKMADEEDKDAKIKRDSKGSSTDR